MESWIDFGRGPLFRLSFCLMVLGLIRVVALTVIEIGAAYRRNSDRIIAWREVLKQTFAWLFPVARLWRKRPLYGSVSVLFHAGLLLVPVFLAAHVLLWKGATGLAWPALPQKVADWLTLIAIAGGIGLLLGRLLNPGARALSRPQDYMWPGLLVVPFATGYICSNVFIGPKAYQVLMLVHVYSAVLIMAAIPFTKIAHCVLAPLSQLVTAVSWKFIPEAGDRVAATLGHQNQPTWAAKARLTSEEHKEVCAK